MLGGDLRGSDDHFGIHQFLVELGILAILVRRCHQCVALVLKPLPKPQLVLCRAQELGNVLGMLFAIVEDQKYFRLDDGTQQTTSALNIVETVKRGKRGCSAGGVARGSRRHVAVDPCSCPQATDHTPQMAGGLATQPLG